MGLFDFLKPKKTDYKALLLSEIEDLRKEYNVIGAFFDKVTPLITNHQDEEWNAYFKNHPERSPKMYMASFLCNEAADMLESGHYHMYRGTLNLQGQQLYKLLQGQLDVLVASGEMDTAHRSRYLNDLDNNIRNAG